MEFKTDFDASANPSANQPNQTDSLDLRFRNSLELVPVALLLVELNGTIAFVNPETEILFGYRAAELITTQFELLVAERFRREHSEHGKGFFAIPTAQEVDAGQNLYGLRKNGLEIPIEVRLRTIHHEGRCLLLCTMLELAAWERSQVQLAIRTHELVESNTEFHAYSHLAAHDLQEPLRKIVSSLQALVDDHADKLETEARRWVDHAVDGAKRMQRLVTDLLAFSLFSSHSRPMHPVDPNAALRVVLNNLAFAIEESSAQIICHPLPWLVADENQLITLLQNLIDNAIRYRGDIAPRIEIGAELALNCVQVPELYSQCPDVQDTDYVFYIRDNAIGIASEYFERIFIVFQRLHSRHEYAGTGMGLAFCKKIVERHGGRIWLESTPKHGSTFYFTWGSARSILA